MIARIWRTRFDESRLDALVAFANETSLAVLSAQPGNRGVQFLANGDEWLTITYWQDQAAIDALVESESYQAIVGEIMAAGFLVGDSETTTYEMHGAAPAL